MKEVVVDRGGCDGRGGVGRYGRGYYRLPVLLETRMVVLQIRPEIRDAHRIIHVRIDVAGERLLPFDVCNTTIKSDISKRMFLYTNTHNHLSIKYH